MTKNPEEENTTEQTEETPISTEEPTKNEQQTEDTPTTDTSTTVEEPAKTEEQPEATPPSGEEPEATPAASEEPVPSQEDEKADDKGDDLFDTKPGTVEMENQSHVENGPVTSQEERGVGDQAKDGRDGATAVPETEEEKQIDAAPEVQPSPAAEESAASDGNADAAPADESDAAPATQQEPESQDTPADVQATPTEAQDTPTEAQDTPTEAQDPQDPPEAKQEEEPASTETAAASAAAEEDGDDTRAGGDEVDSAAPVPESAPANDGGETLAVEAADTRPATQEEDYEDDFSEMSEKSNRGAATSDVVTGAVVGQDASDEAVSAVSKSPTPSAKDEDRAEAGAVVPVPVTVKKSDGWSLVEERGEIRGEDRSEVQGDGEEDSRGQGQWKPEEEALLESSLVNQQAEKEALQNVIDEKVKLQKEYEELKGRFLALEEGSRKWEMEVVMLKERCQQQEQRIKELEAQETKLREFEQWGKDNEAKVKDLQGRLSTLAVEDADKDRRIQKLEEDVQETNSRLIAAERQATISNETAARQTPAPQSKTCIVM